MRRHDSRPLQIRIARLEDKLHKDDTKKGAGFLADPSRAISIAAFIISIVTTLYSWRKDRIEELLANKKQLNDTIQQQIETAIKSYEFSTKNKADPNLATMAGWFNAQNTLMARKAAEGLAELNSRQTVDYLMVGQALLTAGNSSNAIRLYRQALQVAKQKRAEAAKDPSWIHLMADKIKTTVLGDKTDDGWENDDNVLLMDEANSHLFLGFAYYFENNPGAGDEFETAINLIKTSTRDDDWKAFQVSFAQKNWYYALVQKDCGKARTHMEAARDVYPSGMRVTENLDWTTIQYTLGWLNANCGPDGHIQSNSAMPPTAAAQAQPFGMSPR